MGAATYRIGPSDFFLPTDLQADADTLDGQVRALDDALNGNEQAPTDWFDGWNRWLAQWRGFYTQHFGGFFADLFSSLNDSNRDQLISYENQYATWAQQASGYGSTPPGAQVQPSTGSGDTLGKHVADQAKGLPSLGSITWLVVAVVGLLVAWAVLK